MSDHAARVVAINARGAKLREAMQEAREDVNAMAAKVRRKLAKRFPGEDFDRDIAAMFEQTGQGLRAEHDRRETKRRELVRDFVRANEKP